MATAEIQFQNPFANAPTYAPSTPRLGLKPVALVDNLDHLPDFYASRAYGDCLDPVFKDGDPLAFTKLGAARAGEYVGIWFKPQFVRPGHHQAMVKRLVFALPNGFTVPVGDFDTLIPLITVDMLNPPRRLHLRADHILAMHRCLGVVSIDNDGGWNIPRKWMEDAR